MKKKWGVEDKQNKNNKEYEKRKWYKEKLEEGQQRKTKRKRRGCEKSKEEEEEEEEEGKEKGIKEGRAAKRWEQERRGGGRGG